MVMQDHAVEYSLARDAQSVRHARQIVSDVINDADRAAVLETALLLVSELVGNAVRYGQEPITIDVRRVDGAWIIGVSDASATMPAMPPPAPAMHIDHGPGDELTPDEPVGGRGLRLIETLADEWGVDKRPSGKRVWFRLRRRR